MVAKLSRLISTKRKAAVFVAIWTLGVLTIASGTYFLRSPDPVTLAQGEPAPPDARATPEPGFPPDTTKPFWYVPYLNQERDRPKFEGTIAGIKVRATPVEADGFSVCPIVGLVQLGAGVSIEAARNAGPLHIDDRALPIHLKSTQVPDVWKCESSVVEVSWVFAVEPGAPGVDGGGGSVTILRSKGGTTAAATGSAGRWKDQLIGGRPGLVMAPVLVVGDHVLGACSAAVIDEKTGVLTQVIASGGTAEFCRGIAEEVQK